MPLRPDGIATCPEKWDHLSCTRQPVTPLWTGINKKEQMVQDKYFEVDWDFLL